MLLEYSRFFFNQADGSIHGSVVSLNTAFTVFGDQDIEITVLTFVVLLRAQHIECVSAVFFMTLYVLECHIYNSEMQTDARIFKLYREIVLPIDCLMCK